MTIPDRLPPHSPEAESGLLGCVLLNAKITMAELRGQLTAEMFYDLRHQILWRAACELFDSQRPCDISTLLIEIRKANCFNDVYSAVQFLDAVCNSSPSAHNWEHYYEIVRERFILRKIIQHSSEFSQLAYNASAETEPILSRFESESLAIRHCATMRAEFVDFKATRKLVLDEYERAMTETERPGLRTGFIDLDRIVGGLRAQEFIVVAGTPSAGKTSLVLNIAAKAAAMDVKSGFISLETSGKKLVHRLNCIASGACGHRLLNGKPLQGDMDALCSANHKIKTIADHVMIYDQGVNAPQAVSIMRRMHAKGARLFILDYLQLLEAGQKTSNGNERITLVSRAMKAAAKELDSPLICISSLNRESSKENRAPKQSDLRESGQLEFDADVIWLLHSTDQGSECRTVECNVSKNKDGETGKVILTFKPSSMQFENSAL